MKPARLQEPWYLSLLRRNPPKHPQQLEELCCVRRCHSATGLDRWSSAKADKQLPIAVFKPKVLRNEGWHDVKAAAKTTTAPD